MIATHCKLRAKSTRTSSSSPSRSMGSSNDEFPLLSGHGVYASNIHGDGNCLFNALSDQLYGHQGEHANIRSRVIEHMREHADYYKNFIDVNPGGGSRRNPKRKNAGAYSSPANFESPSAADIDRVFDAHLETMARGGTYGDNMEITAFSSAFEYDVKIYQRDFAYMISGAGEGGHGKVAHIAYHTWEHYSSIRNLDGPHTGLPEVTPKALSPQEEQMQKEKLAQTSHVLPWMVDQLEACLPFSTDKPSIKRALEAAKGNVDMAYNNLVDAEEHSSTSSQHSSSVERDHDSDDDLHDGPNKKQDRRMSRSSRVNRAARCQESKHALSKLATLDGSQESFGSSSYDSEASSVPGSSQNSTATPPTSVEGPDITAKSFDKAPQHHTAAGAQSPAKPLVRLKLLPPRPIDPSQHRANRPEQKPSSSNDRVSARDKKSIAKQAQKAARKERHQTADSSTKSEQSATEVGMACRAKGASGTPPLNGLRTLFI